MGPPQWFKEYRASFNTTPEEEMETQTYWRAVNDGYLMTDGPASDSLASSYFAHCREVVKPYIVVTKNQDVAEIELCTYPVGILLKNVQEEICSMLSAVAPNPSFELVPYSYNSSCVITLGIDRVEEIVDALYEIINASQYRGQI